MSWVSWADVQQLRDEVTEEFKNRATDDPATGAAAGGPALAEDMHGHVVGEIIDARVAEFSARRVQVGEPALTSGARRALRRRVHDSIFGAGRFQPLLDLPGIRNIEAEGCDSVWLEFDDGRLEPGPPVAETDEQLQVDVQHMARTLGGVEKEFSPARPVLRMALPDGSRLAAEGFGVSARPSVTIRKHAFVDTDLDEIQALGTIEDGLREFLAAAVRAGVNVVVSGRPGAGKTTLARALLNTLDPRVRLATIEAAYELHVNKMPDRHYRVWAAEAAAGGEVGADGARAGRVDLTRLHELALQKNPDRVIVGEVTGEEILVMLEAMQSGGGSLSTIHATSARDTVERMVTLVTRSRGNLGTTYAERLVAQNVHLIVHLGVVDEKHLPGGRVHRYVDEVVALQLRRGAGVGESPVEVVELWAPGPDGRGHPTGDRPAWLDELARHGFDPAWLQPGAETWGPEPDYVTRPGSPAGSPGVSPGSSGASAGGSPGGAGGGWG